MTLLFIGIVTVAGNYCVNKTLQYEKAARATAYYNLELIYTFAFDVFVMNSRFTHFEILGLLLIILANIYMYIVNSIPQ